jgi:L-rhamnose mutarotase
MYTKGLKKLNIIFGCKEYCVFNFMKKRKEYFLACDLKNDVKLIEKYKEFHLKENAWPEVSKSIKASGIIDMKIFISGNRLVMKIEVDENFSFEKKARMDANNEMVVKWEKLMSQFQQPLPWAKEDEKWVLMEPVFRL